MSRKKRTHLRGERGQEFAFSHLRLEPRTGTDS